MHAACCLLDTGQWFFAISTFTILQCGFCIVTLNTIVNIFLCFYSYMDIRNDPTSTTYAYRTEDSTKGPKILDDRRKESIRDIQESDKMSNASLHDEYISTSGRQAIFLGLAICGTVNPKVICSFVSCYSDKKAFGVHIFGRRQFRHTIQTAT
jgi:hypothetical protein